MKTILKIKFITLLFCTNLFSMQENDELKKCEDIWVSTISEYKRCEENKSSESYKDDKAFQEATDALHEDIYRKRYGLAVKGYVPARIWRENYKIKTVEEEIKEAARLLTEEELRRADNRENYDFTSLNEMKQKLTYLSARLSKYQGRSKSYQDARKRKVKILRDKKYYEETGKDIAPSYLNSFSQGNTNSALGLIPLSQEYLDLIKSETTETFDDFDDGSIDVSYEEGSYVVTGQGPSWQMIDYFGGFHNDLHQTTADLSSLKVKDEAAIFINEIIKAINKKYLKTKFNKSDDFCKFILDEIEKYSDLAFTLRPSYEGIKITRDSLIHILNRHSEFGSFYHIWYVIQRLMSSKNAYCISSPIEHIKARLITLSEINRYLLSLSRPSEFLKLTYVELYGENNNSKTQGFYDQHKVEDIVRCVGNIRDSAQRSLFYFQSIFLNKTYAPYQGLFAPTQNKIESLIDFMGYANNIFNSARIDFKMMKLRLINDHKHFSYRTDPYQDIFVFKKGNYVVRIEYSDLDKNIPNKRIVGYLKQYPFYTDGTLIELPGSTKLKKKYLLVNQSSRQKNEILKFAMDGHATYLIPANAENKDGWINTASWSIRDALNREAHLTVFGAVRAHT